MPSSSSSSPSLTILHPDLAPAPGARFNPLFIHASGTHSQGPKKQNSAASNAPPHPLQQGAGQAAEPPSRKVHVVYYLSRGGQLEHPHLLEVSIPSNQGLYLRDVKRRLAMIRGKRLPSTFAWSYKRSYKNGYVWQDLCEDDLIFPAHGCEYVLKGSEILSDESSAVARAATQVGSREEQERTSENSKIVYRNYDEAAAAVGSANLLQASMVDNGTDAATQTEEDLRPSIESMYAQAEENSRSFYGNYGNPALKQSPHRQGSCSILRSENAIELNKADMASPPSSSSATNSPSPYKEVGSTSSSSASGFSIARETGSDNVNSNQRGNQENIANQSQLGSKTPGRSWMKRPTRNSEEPEEIVSILAGDQGVSNPDNSPIENQALETVSKTKHKSVASNSIGAVIMEDTDQQTPPSPAAKPNRSKHSGALSLLQFMSCGGIDIKEQILPMSLYRLRSKGTPGVAGQLHMSSYIVSPEHPSEVFGYGHSSDSSSAKSWKMERPKNVHKNNSKLLYRVTCNDYKHTPAKVDKQASESTHNTFNHRLNPGQHDGSSAPQATSSSPMGNGSSAKAVIPDVISIGRSSISDRSTNASRELEYQVAGMDFHLRAKKSSDILHNYVNNPVNASPLLAGSARATTSLDSGSNITNMQAGATRAVSGEILMSKGSPLFVPAKRHMSYSGTPLNYSGFNKPPLPQLADTTTGLSHFSEGGKVCKVDSSGAQPTSAGSCNPSRAFSEGEVSSLLLARTVLSKSGHQRSTAINGYDRSMADLWEELLAAPATAHYSCQQQRPRPQLNEPECQRVRQMVTTGATPSEVEMMMAMRDRTLQNALDMSLHPPLEHLVPECPHCGRKVKAELLKAHVKSCSSPKSSTKVATNLSNICNHNNGSSLGKSPKSDSHLCQRFLRASPPPTKI